MSIKRALVAAACVTGAMLGVADGASAYMGVQQTFGRAATDQTNPGDGEFAGKPEDIEVDPVTGHVFVLDTWVSDFSTFKPSMKIQEFDADGNFVKATGILSPQENTGQNATPGSIAIQRSDSNPSVGAVLLTAGTPQLWRFDVADITAAPAQTTVSLNPNPIDDGFSAQLQSVSVDQSDGSYV